MIADVERQELEWLRAEIARLKAERDHQIMQNQLNMKHWREQAERLKAALQEIVDDESRSYVAMQMIARAALEGK